MRLHNDPGRLSPRILVTLLAGTAVALAAMPAHAEDEDEIKTDRPDFVESSDAVGKGRVQVETSFAVERNHADGRRDRMSTTPTLLRFGTGEAWELRLETDGRTSLRTSDDANGQTTTVHGYSDLSLGMKWHVRDQEGTNPALGWLLHADVDSGSRAFRGNGVRPSLRMVAEWQLPNDLSVDVMPGITYDKTEDGRRFFSGIFGIVLGKSWNDRFRTFIELAAPQIAHARYGGSNVTYDVGAAYLLSRNWQIDVALQEAANRNTPDHTWSIGLSTRF